MDLSGHQFKAIIFDCDGTLLDTATLHFQAFEHALALQGETLDRAWYLSRTGLSADRLLQAFAASFSCRIDVDAAIRDSSVRYLASVTKIQEFSDVADVARRYFGALPTAVASGGQRASVTKSLEVCGLVSLFDHIITIEDVSAGKPSPALFLTAAARLATLPQDCLVFEDTDAGLEAARRAGMPSIDVRALRSQA